jgi:predicted secreted protein
MRGFLKEIFSMLGCLLVVACSFDTPTFEQPYLRTTQLLNSSISADIKPIVLPNSGSRRILSVIQQQHLIQIVSNPSTGYHWEMKFEEPVKGCLSITDRNMVYDSPDAYADGVRRVGAPGKQEWLIQTNCAGLYRLTFNYRRPWEQGPPLYTTVAEFATTK